MTTIRSIFYLLFLSTTVILYAVPISILGWIVPFKITSRISQQWALINLWALRTFCRLDYRVEGKENMPSSNCIILCKHQSAWETIALRALLPPEHTWVLKRELLWVPFFGWALAPLHPIAIDRKAGRRAIRQLIKEGKYRLGQGRWIVIFPEGTRVAPGQRKPYGHGGGILAQKSGYPILPIAHNAGVFWRRRGINKHPGCIDVVIGKPLDTKGLSSTDITRRAEDWIESCVARLPQERS